MWPSRECGRNSANLGVKLAFFVVILGINLQSFEGATRNEQINATSGFRVSGPGHPQLQQKLAEPSNHGFEYEEDQIEYEDEDDDQDFDEDEDDDEEEFEDEVDAESLVEMVKGMEKEAEVSRNQPRTKTKVEIGLLPRIYGALSGVFGGSSKIEPTGNTTSIPEKLDKKLQIDAGGDLPEDFSDKYFREDVFDDVAAGIEESLSLSGGPTSKTNEELVAENREFAFYMFQGQYMAEPRLNRFVDGAIRNMITEMKGTIMDPLFFRVLPRGQVVSRLQQNRQKNTIKLGIGARRRRRRRPFRNRRPGVRRRKIRRRVPKQVGGNRGVKRKVKNRGKRRRKLGRVNQRKVKIRRRQRNAVRGIGSGRVEGLSKIERDGDSEMLMFGNYTMIRSHMKIGPVLLNMQFRTRRGLRSTGASLPSLKVHKVTRVNLAGSEMVDFVLDRPHPETIQLRGKLFPMAERVAKNIFARLFVPNSFLVARIREKVGLAMLSKPKISDGLY